MAPLLEPGADLDGFKVSEHLHAGAMGDIYRVTHPAHALPLVLKIPRLDRGPAAENLLGFEMESMLLPVLSGPHVPRFVAAGDLTKVPYLVLEFIPGASLQQRLEDGPLAAEDVARLGAETADALHSIHRQAVVHLDLKPDNILVREGGGVALIDFGLAHHARFPDLLAEEQRFTAGSAPYVSPEQIDGCRSDVRSDLFALGVVLYEMATGELPFGRPESASGLRDRLWLDPSPPSAHVASIPPWLQEIILRCLEVNAATRYQTAALVAFDLRHPQQVQLTRRATKLARAGVVGQIRRWWGNRHRPAAARRGPTVAHTPVILVAVDTEHPDDARQEAMHRTTQLAVASSAEVRLICVTVLRGDEVTAHSGDDPHLEHLVRLRHWVEPLQLPPERLSLHVLAATSASAAILEFARSNHVDLIIMGAPGKSRRNSWWRSAASAVAANATCSVHLVRVPERTGEKDAEEEPMFSEDDLP